MPRAEIVHWLFATGILAFGLCLLARAIVGEVVWNQRLWRRLLLPSVLLGIGVFMWPVTVFFVVSPIHMLAHTSWPSS